MTSPMSLGRACLPLAGALLCAASWAQTTTRASVDSSGVQANFDCRNPSLSADGRWIAFESEASNLVPGDTNNFLDVFVHDRSTGATTRVSVSSSGAQGIYASYHPTISAD